MCRPSGALGWLGHGLSTASPRRPTEAACILYAFFGKASQCPERGVAHFCACPRPAVSGIHYAGMPDLVVGPAKSDLRLKNGAPGRARTSCLRFRKPPLCPDELREPGAPEDAGARPCALRHGCIRALRAAVIPTDRSALGQVRSPLRRRQSRSRFRPILEIRGSVSLRARLAGATGLRSARLSVLRNVIGESWTGVSPVR